MTDTGDVLRVAGLRRACVLLLDTVENQFGAQVALADVGIEYYWNVDLRAAFETNGRPAEHLDCGQVSDDLTELAELLRRGPEVVVSPWHDLQYVAGLLKCLSALVSATVHHATDQHEREAAQVTPRR